MYNCSEEIIMASAEMAGSVQNILKQFVIAGKQILKFIISHAIAYVTDKLKAAVVDAFRCAGYIFCDMNHTNWKIIIYT